IATQWRGSAWPSRHAKRLRVNAVGREQAGNLLLADWPSAFVVAPLSRQIRGQSLRHLLRCKEWLGEYRLQRTDQANAWARPRGLARKLDCCRSRLLADASLLGNRQQQTPVLSHSVAEIERYMRLCSLERLGVVCAPALGLATQRLECVIVD